MSAESIKEYSQDGQLYKTHDMLNGLSEMDEAPIESCSTFTVTACEKTPIANQVSDGSSDQCPSSSEMVVNDTVMTHPEEESQKTLCKYLKTKLCKAIGECIGDDEDLNELDSLRKSLKKERALK